MRKVRKDWQRGRRAVLSWRKSHTRGVERASYSSENFTLKSWLGPSFYGYRSR